MSNNKKYKPVYDPKLSEEEIKDKLRNGGIRVYKRFGGVDTEYFANIKITPESYNTIHVNSIIVADNATDCYKIQRSMAAKSFGVMTDRFYAGLLAVYAEIFKEMDKHSYNDEKFSRLYVFAHETENDLETRTISFDINFIPSVNNNGNEDVDADKIKEIIGNDTNKFTAIFNYGKIYSDAITKLDLFNRVYHLKAFKVQDEGMHRVKLPSGIYYNNDDTNSTDYIRNLLNDDSDILKYTIGITKEEIKK